MEKKGRPGHPYAHYEGLKQEQIKQIIVNTLNNWDVVYVGINDGGRPVDVYFKVDSSFGDVQTAEGGHVAITERGEKREVITAYYEARGTKNWGGVDEKGKFVFSEFTRRKKGWKGM